MTTCLQKKRERSILDFYLNLVQLDGNVVSQESPDFIVTTGTERIGVEVTEYHQPRYTEHSFSRTQVEAEWEKLREALVKYRDNHVGLENLSVLLSFKSLEVPNARQHADFIKAVHSEITRIKTDLTDHFTTIRINDQHSEVLKRHLKKIDIRISGCYIEWDWNYAFSAVGTSDAELVSILDGKFGLKRAETIDQLHLVMAGDSPSGGTYIGYLCPELLEGYSCLNMELNKSDYSVMAILGYEETHIWRRDQGWSLISHMSDSEAGAYHIG